MQEQEAQNSRFNLTKTLSKPTSGAVQTTNGSTSRMTLKATSYYKWCYIWKAVESKTD
jgi:hypothetical protein